MLSIYVSLGKIRNEAETGQAQCAHATNNCQDRPTGRPAEKVHNKSSYKGSAGDQNEPSTCHSRQMSRLAPMLYFLYGLHKV
jgi:hypothetical protein